MGQHRTGPRPRSRALPCESLRTSKGAGPKRKHERLHCSDWQPTCDGLTGTPTLPPRPRCWGLPGALPSCARACAIVGPARRHPSAPHLCPRGSHSAPRRDVTGVRPARPGRGENTCPGPGPAKATAFPPRGPAAEPGCGRAPLHSGRPQAPHREAPPAGRSWSSAPGAWEVAVPLGPRDPPCTPAHLLAKWLGQGALQGAPPRCGLPAGSPAPKQPQHRCRQDPVLGTCLAYQRAVTVLPGPLRRCPERGVWGSRAASLLRCQPSAKTLQSHGGPPRPHRPAGRASPRFNKCQQPASPPG